jgi:hypothetical protein
MTAALWIKDKLASWPRARNVGLSSAAPTGPTA